MNDLISRQAALEAVEHIDWYHQNSKGEMVSGANSAEHQAWYKADDIYKALEDLPSAQPEIIRCKDCKHRGETEDGEYNPEDIVCAYWMSDGLSETDYCSYAERRTK